MFLKKFNVVKEEFDPARIERMKRDGYEEYKAKSPKKPNQNKSAGDVAETPTTPPVNA